MLRETQEGLILPVKASAGASKNTIMGWQNGWFKIKVCAPPEKGKANQAIILMLSEALQLPQSRIILLRGATSQQKEFLLVAFTKTEFESAL